MKKKYRVRAGAFFLVSALTVSSLSTFSVLAADQKYVAKSALEANLSEEEKTIEKTEEDIKNELMEKETGLVYQNEFTMEEPVKLETLDLKECEGPGTFAFEEPEFVPEKGVSNCLLIFIPEDVEAHQYEMLKGWDEETRTVRRYVTVICTSLKLEEEERAKEEAGIVDMESGGEVAADTASEVTGEPTVTETPETVPDATEAPEVTTAPDTTEAPEVTTVPDTTEAPETTKAPEATKEPEATNAPEATKTPEATKVPEVKEPVATKVPTATITKVPEATKAPETTKIPEATKSPEVTTVPEATESPEATKVPEAPKTPGATNLVGAITIPGTLDKNDVAENGNENKVPVETDALKKSEAVSDAEAQIEALKEDNFDDEAVKAVIDAAITLDTLTDEEKAAVSDEMKEKLAAAQQLAAEFNHESNGVIVSGNVPWYVKLTVTIGNDTDTYVPSGLETIVPYEMQLWDLMADCRYELAIGEKVTLSMAVPKNIDLYDGLTIVHYMDENHFEYIELHIEGDVMSFETGSFSPFNVAGSTVIVGGKQPSSGSSTSTGGNPSAGSQGSSTSDKETSGSGSSNKGSSSTSGNAAGGSSSSSGSSGSTSSSGSNSSSNGSNSGSSTSSGSSIKNKDHVIAAQTGDNAETTMYLVIAAVAAVVCTLCITVMILRKKRNKK